MFPTIGRFDKTYGPFIVTKKRLIKLSRLEATMGNDLDHNALRRLIVKNIQRKSLVYLEKLRSNIQLKSLRDYLMPSFLGKLPILRSLEEYYVLPSAIKRIIHFAKSKEKKYQNYIDLEPDWDIKDE